MKQIEVTYSNLDVLKVTRAIRSVPKALPRIMSRALNSTATTVRAETSRALSKKTTMKISIVKKAINFTKATYRRWEAKLDVFTKRIPLIHFEAKPSGTGVKYSIGRRFVHGGFIQEMPVQLNDPIYGHLHRGVFARQGKSRLPIHEQYGPSLGVVLEESADMLKKTTDGAGAILEKNVDAQIRLTLEQGK